jgi:hypothetical protein
MFTADQLVAHAIGDYIFQSDWMANNKRKNDWAATIHALTYTLPFVFITQVPLALWFIFFTHYLVDRYGLARFVVWLKNWPFETYEVPGSIDGYATRLKPITPTGYDADKPPFLAVWLFIIADNIIHVLCNGLVIWYFA